MKNTDRSFLKSMESDIRRIAIFLCYDRDGIIDDYVLYLLHDLKENLTDLVVVINGKLSGLGKERLQTVTDKIYIRKNIGADAGAWKDAMCDYLGWEKLASYDEIVLLNDSFYGPFYPFHEVFAAMNGKNLDFWGLLAHGEADITFYDCPYPHLPEHIQSYFTVIRKSMHTSPEFKEYWEKMPYFATVQDVISKHEVVFTRYFSELGFTWDVLTDTRDLDGKYPEGRPVAYCFLNTYELIKNRRFPILKRHCFGFSYQKHLSASNGMHLRQSMEYIAEHTNYDVRMIYKNIVRLYNITDIFYNLQLIFVLPKHFRIQAENKVRRAVMVFHNEYLTSLEYMTSFLFALPAFVDVIVTVGKNSDIATVENRFRKDLGARLKVLPAREAGGELYTLLSIAAPYLQGYDYMGFCHDVKSAAHEVFMVGASRRELMEENLAGSEAYVENLLDLFEQRPEIGLLCVPPPNHARYSKKIMDSWQEDFEPVKELLEELHLNVRLTGKRAPLMAEMAFWCKREAVETILKNTSVIEKFLLNPLTTKGNKSEAAKLVFPYAVQHHGYLTGWALTDEYARTEINNIHYVLNDTKRLIKKKEKRIAGLININNGMLHSKSWRITEPLRKMMRLIKRVFLSI